MEEKLNDFSYFWGVTPSNLRKIRSDMEDQNAESAFIKFKSLSMSNNEEESDKYDVKDMEEYEGEGEPRDLSELKILLDYIKRNYESFKLEDVKRLKTLFTSWIEKNRDLTQEEFKIYSDLVEARDIIRGTSDTEDGITTEEEDNNDDSNDEENNSEDNEDEGMYEARRMNINQ